MLLYFTIHVIICILLMAVILFQDGKAGGLTSVADSSQVVFGAKGAASFLTKLTSVLAVAFFASSMLLAYYATPSNKSIAADYEPEQTQESTVTPTPDEESGLGTDGGQTTEIKKADELTPEERRLLGLDKDDQQKPEGEQEEPPAEGNGNEQKPDEGNN